MDTKKLKEIHEISNGCTLYAVIIAGELQNIYVDTTNGEIFEIKIYNNQTFLEFKNKVSFPENKLRYKGFGFRW